MAVEIQETSEHAALDGILLQHLHLEPQGNKDETSQDKTRRRTVSQPPMKFNTEQNSKVVVNRSTIESNNKKRPGISKRNASKYEPPPPEPPDPNSEAKSVTIQRMQTSVEDWNKQFDHIIHKKERNDGIYRAELEDRDKKLNELTKKYSTEHKKRVEMGRERDQFSDQLQVTEEDLLQHQGQVELLQSDLTQYQLAYQEMEAQKTTLENELTVTTEQLETSEGMRRRLNDHVTELQGQLAIEEQRSKFCVLF